MSFVCVNMASIKLLLLLACVVLVQSAGLWPAARADAELEAEAEAAGAAEIERALGVLQAALGDAREPWTRRLGAAQEALAPLLAALEAHTATVLLHSRRRINQLQPAIEERLEAARALLARTQQELIAGAHERGAAALAEVAAVVARAQDQLASLAPSTPPPADQDSAGGPSPH